MIEKEISKDVIYRDVPLFLTISESIWKKYFLEKNYGSILHILLNGPMTINEIYTRSESVLEKRKSEATIYRYLKRLINAQLVMEVGHRICGEKTFSKRLYSLFAQYVVFDNADESVWISPQGTTIAQAIGLVVNRHFDNKRPLISQLTNLFLNIEKSFTNLREKTLRNILEQTTLSNQSDYLTIERKCAEIIKKIDAKDFYNFYNQLGIVLGFLTDNTLLTIDKSLKTCFSQEKEEESSQETSDSKRKTPNLVYFQPTLIKPVEWLSVYLVDRNYNVILKMLSSGPMTINEIHARHHKMITERSEPSYHDHKSKFKPKSKNTIYKYVQELIGAGFVTEAGRRSIPNQSATQKLYSTTAEIFVGINYGKDFWHSSRARNITSTIGLALCSVLDRKTFNHDKLHEAISNFNVNRNKAAEEALRAAKEVAIKRYLRNFGGQESGTFLYTLGLIEWLKKQDNLETFREEVLSCFSQ